MRTPSLSQVLALSLLTAIACERKNPKLEEMNLSETEAKRILAEISASRVAPPPPAPSPKARVATDAGSSQPKTEHQALDPELKSSNWVVDGLADVGPAAPSVAAAQGVVLINGENELFLARLGRLPRGTAPQETPIAALTGEHGRFALGRGPSVADGYAYWVTSHFLLRRPVTPPYGPLDILASDARVGTRAAALAGNKATKRPTWVGYVALPTVKNGPLRAKLWYGEEHEAVLTEPGTSTLSVQLSEREGEVVALMLEARTGQSSLHARNITVGKPPRPGADRVIWVGGSPHSTTELSLMAPGSGSTSSHVLTFLPLERDVTHFGLATLRFTALDASREPAVHWIPYENGINPAPVSSAEICGHDVVLFARPSTSAPGSPQELVFAELRNGESQAGIVLARSKAFYDVSIAALPRGALVSYVADYRTWARTVRCTR